LGYAAYLAGPDVIRGMSVHPHRMISETCTLISVETAEGEPMTVTTRPRPTPFTREDHANGPGIYLAGRFGGRSEDIVTSPRTAPAL